LRNIFLAAWIILSLAALNAARHPAMPNPKFTPGEVRTTDAAEVCRVSTKEFRHTSEATKKQVCFNYGIKNCPHQGTMEIDHLIPLELGGADTEANLWPQPAKPIPGFHEKDKLENYLHKQVCAGKMALVDAQAMIRTDWYVAYKNAGLK
jgi:hypothetical protein